MQGLELSRGYYEEYGRKMIASLFPGYESRIAVGLAGPGSDCLGFDDGISTDHDFGAGFCVWLTDEDFEAIGSRLRNMYDSLPAEYMGIKKECSGRYGVRSISDFFLPLTGLPGAPETDMQWLHIPEYSLAAAVSGEVFRDDLGTFTRIRNIIKYEMPEDVRLKKAAARAVSMAQSGQYNFMRCIKHGEYGAAALAKSEFVKETARLIYLLNGQYAPFYKWALKGIERLPEFSELGEKLNGIVCSETSDETAGDIFAEIEAVSGIFIEYFRKNHLSDSGSDYLEHHAFEIIKHIKNENLRNLHIMEG